MQRISRKSQSVLWALYLSILGISFVVIGFLLVARATGYRYNAQVGHWQKTGMIIATVDPKNSILTIDAKKYTISQNNTHIPDLLPGTYRIEINSPGYHSWEETVTIRPGYAIDLPDVQLFFSHPVDVPPTDKAIHLVTDPILDDNLHISDGELWLNTQLISRFSDSPYSAIMLPDQRHVIYSLGNQIRVIQIDGENDTLLYTRSTDTMTNLALVDNDVIGFSDNGQVKTLQIY